MIPIDNIERALPRIFPFAAFMACIGITELVSFLAAQGIMTDPEFVSLYLYPLKIIATATLLIYYRHTYTELNWKNLKYISNLSWSLLLGIVVFVLWINMDWPWATIGTAKGYNPTVVADNFTRWFLIISRVIGASIVVPIMEELFWRSWLLRYLIDQDFGKIPLGTFTWASFASGSVMFGLEHNLWLAGIMAGATYSLLLYKTRSLTACILAHGITNALLAGYVLISGNWGFW